jgi:hypothetical protein
MLSIVLANGKSNIPSFKDTSTRFPISSTPPSILAPEIRYSVAESHDPEILYISLIVENAWSIASLNSEEFMVVLCETSMVAMGGIVAHGGRVLKTQMQAFTGEFHG